MESGPVPSFGYDEFGAWYDEHRAAVLEPALERATTLLAQELDDLLSDRDLARIRNVAGRVKSKRRTWRKLRRYQLATVENIPAAVDDLVGLRITCTNLRDLEMVQAALESLPARPTPQRPLALDPVTARDYVELPKESGYRGWHVDLAVLDGETPVTCELQVRTLLQDSWGELTHEDTYSKAGELPPLVEILSKRMADLLATLDDIAEDLRSELDRIDEAAVGERASTVPAPDAVTGRDDGMSGLAADAAELLRDRWRRLDRPLDLASLAWALQQEFGAEVSDDWFGHGSFKRFLLRAVPGGEISTGRQAYLLPPGADGDTPDAAGPSSASTGRAEPSAVESDDRATAATSPAAESGIPEEARRLRRIDRGFPLLESAGFARIYTVLADAWRDVGVRAPDTRRLNVLTRSARDRAAATGEPVARRHLDYVAKAVLAATGPGEVPSAERLAETFVESTLQRMADLRIVAADDGRRRAAIARWLLG